MGKSYDFKKKIDKESAREYFKNYVKENYGTRHYSFDDDVEQTTENSDRYRLAEYVASEWNPKKRITEDYAKKYHQSFMNGYVPNVTGAYNDKVFENVVKLNRQKTNGEDYKQSLNYKSDTTGTNYLNRKNQLNPYTSKKSKNGIPGAASDQDFNLMLSGYHDIVSNPTKYSSKDYDKEIDWLNNQRSDLKKLMDEYQFRVGNWKFSVGEDSKQYKDADKTLQTLEQQYHDIANAILDLKSAKENPKAYSASNEKNKNAMPGFYQNNPFPSNTSVNSVLPSISKKEIFSEIPGQSNNSKDLSSLVYPNLSSDASLQETIAKIRQGGQGNRSAVLDSISNQWSEKNRDNYLTQIADDMEQGDKEKFYRDWELYHNNHDSFWLEKDKMKARERERNLDELSFVQYRSDFNQYSDKGKQKQKETGYINEPELYDEFSDTEKKIYDYHIGKDDKESADAYYELMNEELKRRAGQIKSLELTNDHGAAYRTVFSAATSLGNSVSSLGQAGKRLLLNDTDPIGKSVNQYAHEYMRPELGGVEGVVNDLAYTTANMAPSIAASMIHPGLGIMTIGVQSGGNTYNESRLEGYSDRDALNYAAVSGSAEALTQYALGGLKYLGKSGASKAFSKIFENNDSYKTLSNELNGIFAKLVKNPSVRNTLKKIGTRLGDMNSEGVEEYVQEILDPVFRNITLGENNEFELINGDALYSYLLGALSAGVMNAPFNVNEDAGIRNLGKEIKQRGETQNLIDSALSSDPSGKSWELAQEISNKQQKGKKLSNYDVGQLYQTMQEENITLDQVETIPETSDIVPNSDVDEELQLNQNKKTEADYPLRGSKAVNPNGNTMGSASPDINVSQNNTGVNNRISQNNRNSVSKDAVAEWIGSDTPVTTAGVSKVENGELYVNVKTNNGTETVKSSDLTFQNPNVEKAFQAAAQFDTNGAKAFLSGYHSDTDFDTYYNGFVRAYDAGVSNVPYEMINSVYVSAIAPESAMNAYFAGVNDAKGRFTVGQENATIGTTGLSNVRTTKTVGNTAYTYQSVNSENYSDKARETKSYLDRWGIENDVFDGEVSALRDGETKTPHGEGIALGSESVLIHNNTNQNPKEMASHEAFHLLLHRNIPEAVQYYQSISDNIVVSSDNFNDFCKRLSKSYFNNEFDFMNPNHQIKFYEEMSAYIGGMLYSGNTEIVDYFSSMFDNWDEIVSNWNQVIDALEGGKANGSGESIHQSMGKGSRTVDTGAGRTNAKESGIDGKNEKRSGNEAQDDGSTVEQERLGRVSGIDFLETVEGDIRNVREQERNTGRNQDDSSLLRSRSGERTGSDVGRNGRMEKSMHDHARETTGTPSQETRSRAKGQTGLIQNDVSKKLKGYERVYLHALGKVFNTGIVIDETIEGKKGNGYYDYDTGLIHIARDATGEAYDFVLKHEFTHRMQQKSPKLYQDYFDYVVSYLNKTDAKTFDRLVQAQIDGYRQIGKNISRIEAMDEVVADASDAFLRNSSEIKELVNQNRSLGERIREMIRSMIAKIDRYLKSHRDLNSDAAAMLMKDKQAWQEAERLWTRALLDTVNNKNTVQQNSAGDVLFSLKGVNKNDIEVYETESDIKNLPYKERMQTFLDIMKNQYLGRTAKFTRNGHIYYATFEESDVRKNIYGDKRSDTKGKLAKINTGASGSIFELVENAKYNGSKPESGKNTSSHKGVNYWDYFIKTVQIDNTVFNMIANVRKKDNGQYVYSIQLNQNKKIEAAPPLSSQKRTLNRVLTASDTNVSQKDTGVNSIISKNDGNDTKNPLSIKGTAKLSASQNNQYNYSKSFAEQIDDYKAGKIPKGDTLVVGSTPDVFQKIGLNPLPMTINTTHVDYALNGTKDANHSLGQTLLSQLPTALENPAAIISSQTQSNTSLVVLLPIRYNRNTVIAPVYIDGFGFQNGIQIDSNAITSVFGKNNAVTKLLNDAIQEERNGKIAVYYYNKKIADPLLHVAGLQLPGGLIPHGGYTHSIREKGSPVNNRLENVTYSQQFKRWFGDWEKHPNTASKVVNDDGTPRVMYHGTKTENGDFVVFDNSKAVEKGGLGLKTMGDGNYFTSKKLDGTERYGSRIIESYLNIRKPFELQTGQTFREEVKRRLGVDDSFSYSDIQNKMRELGYDGVIQYGNGEMIAVTFDSNQIKSATDNIGTFDKNNPDIRFSLKNVSKLESEITIDRYTEKEYNDYGWAAVNEVLSPSELRKLNTQFADILHGEQFQKSADGYYVIPVGPENKPQNSFVFIKGTISHPEIAQIIRIDVKNETELDIIRGEFKNGNSFYARKIVEDIYGEEVSYAVYQASDFSSYREIKTKIQSLRRDVGSNRGLSDRGRNQGSDLESLQNQDQVKFSLKNVSKLDYDRVVKENEKQKEMIAFLKDQFKVTKGIKWDKKSIQQTANRILKQYDSNYSAEDFTENLNRIYTYVANSPVVDAEEVHSVVTAMAKSVLEHSQTLDDTMYREYKGLRDRLRETRIKLPDAYHSDVNGGYEAFRRANLGRIRLANDGMSVDVFYQELADSYPEFFAYDNIVHPADQLTRIAEVLDTLKPVYVNPFGMNLDESASVLANEIMEAYFEIPQAKPTYADKQLQKQKMLKLEYQKKIREIKAEYRAKYEEKLKEVNRQNILKIQKVREELKKASAADKAQIAKLKAQIERLTQYNSNVSNARSVALASSSSKKISSPVKQSATKDTAFSKDEINLLRTQVMNRFNLKSINDYIHVQKNVLWELRKDNFFSSKNSDGSESRKVVMSEQGMLVEINASGIKETFGKGKRYETAPADLKVLKLAVVEQLPTIIENAKITNDAVKNLHQDGENKTFIYLEGQADVNGKVVDVRIDLKQSVQKTKFWMHYVDVAETKMPMTSNLLVANNANPTSSELSSTTNSIPQSGTKINMSDNPLYRNAVEQYGAISKGENPIRDVDVPKQTTEDTKVRQFARTAMEAKATPDEMVSEFEREIMDGTFNYNPIEDNTAQKEADTVINHKGFDGALRQWRSVLNNKNSASKNDIVLAEKLYMQAAKNGDYRLAMELAAEIAEEGTRSGQNVQAFRLLKKMSGEGQLVYNERVVDRLNQDLEKRREHGKAEYVEIPQQLKQELLNAKTPEEIDAANQKIYEDLAKQLPPTFADKWNAWRYLAMLGNPRTHVRNVLGNAVFMPTVKLKNLIATGLEAAYQHAGAKTERTKTLNIGKEYKEFAKNDFKQMMDIISGGGKMNPEDIIRDHRRIFRFEPLEKLRKLNSELLEKEDRFFLKRYYINALAGYLSVNHVDLNSVESIAVMERARNYAISEAQKATYRDASAVASAIQRIAHTNAATEFLVEGVLPFKKTPINILRRGVEYSPAGLIYALSVGTRNVKTGKITATQYIDSVSAGLSGSALFVLGAFLNSIGFLRPGGDDEEKKDRFEQNMGYQPYSLQIGNFSYTIDWMAPSVLPLFVGSEVFRTLSKEREGFSVSDFVDDTKKLADPIIEMSMLSGLQNILESISYGDNGLGSIAMNTITGYFGQANPTVLGQAARTIDDTRRTTYMGKNIKVPSDFQKFFQKNMNKIPFVSKLSQPYIDLWGREETQGNILERALQNFVSPGYSSNTSDAERAVEKEITRLYEAVGDKSVFPSTAPKYFMVNKVRKDLTAEEYTKFAKAKGQKAYHLMEQLIQSAGYRSLSDEEKAECVADVYEYATVYGKTQISDYTTNGWKLKALKADKYGGSVVDIILNRQKEKAS